MVVFHSTGASIKLLPQPAQSEIHKCTAPRTQSSGHTEEFEMPEQGDVHRQRGRRVETRRQEGLAATSGVPGGWNVAVALPYISVG